MNTTTVPIKSELHRSFCDNVKARRKELGLTQAEIAKKLDMTPAGYGKIETGEYQPSIETIDRVAKVLGAKPTDLLQEPVNAR